MLMNTVVLACSTVKKIQPNAIFQSELIAPSAKNNKGLGREN